MIVAVNGCDYVNSTQISLKIWSMKQLLGEFFVCIGCLYVYLHFR